jgi:hypothetical protein
MLKAIDILLGVAVVMLVFSAMVTIITQFAISYWNLKGKHLKIGVADLLEQLSPGINRLCAEHIAEKLLLHPLVREGEKKLGSVIHRDELTTLLLDFAGGDSKVKIDEVSRKALSGALAANGISNPAEVLDQVRTVALQIELGNPELSNSLRHNLALLREANSTLLAKINGWFDQTIDRVTDRFTLNTRYITFLAGLSIALVLQLDTITLVNQLAKDPGLREALVQVAKEAAANPPQAGTSQPGTEPQQPAPAGGGPIVPITQQQAMQRLEELSLIRFPESFGAWVSYWSLQKLLLQILGIMLTAILLSLGAPFWYSALTNLLRLRGVLAPKEERDRAERQTTQADSAAVVRSGAGNLG